MSALTLRLLLHEAGDKLLKPEPLYRRVHRILQLGKRHDARFTFFVTTANVRTGNQWLLQDIVSQGHELASHSHEHLDFSKISLSAARTQIARSLEILSRFAVVRGFRAPYLVANDSTVEACRELGLYYHSSRKGRTPKQQRDIWELPVTSPMDYEVIQQEGLLSTASICRRWISFVEAGGVLLFHPWRLGQRKYINALERMLEKDLIFRPLKDFAQDGPACHITFDLDFMQTRQVYLHSAFHLVRSPHLRGLVSGRKLRIAG